MPRSFTLTIVEAMQSLAGYFDHAATSPLRPEVREAMLSLGPIANPGSTHRAGQRASAVLEDARERIAAALGAHPTEVVLTSGGTESINLALKGRWLRDQPRFVSAAIEHHATLDALQWIEQQGGEVSFIGCDADSVTDAAAFAEAIVGENVAATMSLVNNETGVVQPVEAVSEAVQANGATLHIDAVAGAGHIPVDFAALGADFLSVAAHKAGGPVGVGALLVSRAAKIDPLVHGGGQQRGLRSGTGDVQAAVGFAVALEAAVAEEESESARLGGFSARLREVLQGLEGVRVTGGPRMPSLVHFTVQNAGAEALTFLLDEQGLSTSNGSACTAGVVQESHVVREMGGGGAPLRISMGWSTTAEDVDRLAAALPDVVERARRSR